MEVKTLITINEEFEKLIPPLSKEEFEQLEKNILAEGIRDALITWNGFLIDGHNRFEIATRYDLNYETLEKEFDSEDSAKEWIILNQFGRRNLPAYERAKLALKLSDLFKVKALQNMRIAGQSFSPREGSQNSVEVTPIDTQKELAKIAGVSHDTIHKVNTIEKFATPAQKQKLSSGEESIHSVFTEVKKEERKKEIAEQRQEIALSGSMIKGSAKWNVYHSDFRKWQQEKQYDYVITDPPYPKEFLPLFEDLAVLSNRWLKPGGLLIVMSGQSYLHEIYEMMAKHIQYYWTACYLTPGQPTPLRQVNVNTTWKPLLIFRKGEYKGKIFGDVFKSEGNDKDFHKWGQSISGMQDVISKICLPGQSILDPFCGAGTTGVAALRHGCLFDGVELDIENVNISKSRLNDNI